MENNLGYYTKEELKEIGIKEIGINIRLSKFARIYNPETTTIGDNVRIDDFCILTGNIEIGNFVHIGSYSLLSGKNKIKIGNFISISNRVSLYTNNEDYSGGRGLITPTVPEKFQFTQKGEIKIDNHSLIGAHSVLLPCSHLKEGSTIGAMSLVKGICDDWTLYAGIPIKKIKKIPKEIRLNLEKDVYKEKHKNEK